MGKKIIQGVNIGGGGSVYVGAKRGPKVRVSPGDRVKTFYYYAKVGDVELLGGKEVCAGLVREFIRGLVVKRLNEPLNDGV